MDTTRNDKSKCVKNKYCLNTNRWNISMKNNAQ